MIGASKKATKKTYKPKISEQMSWAEGSGTIYFGDGVSFQLKVVDGILKMQIVRSAILKRPTYGSFAVSLASVQSAIKAAKKAEKEGKLTTAPQTPPPPQLLDLDPDPEILELPSKPVVNEKLLNQLKSQINEFNPKYYFSSYAPNCGCDECYAAERKAQKAQKEALNE